MKIITKKVGKNSTISKILSLVENAQDGKIKFSNTIDHISKFFVPSIIVLSLITAFFWFILDMGSEKFFVHMIAVMVIACPCALGLAIPISILVGTSLGAKNGILFKNASVLENVKYLDLIIFDKTGTLTLGKPKLKEIKIFNNWDKRIILQYASSPSLRCQPP